MLFYCEHLEQIKVCHLHVQLDSAADAETSLTVFDRKTLRLRHGFRSFALSMPASIDTQQQFQLKYDTEGLLDRHSFSVRIKALSSLALPNAGANPVPFSDPAFLNEIPLLCKTCQASLLPAGLTWRHLPSEHWQEMMDSWHCHAGVSQHNGHERHEQYTLPANIVHAAQGIMPAAGKPLIGLSHFLVDTTDVATSTVRFLIGAQMEQACQGPKKD